MLAAYQHRFLPFRAYPESVATDAAQVPGPGQKLQSYAHGQHYAIFYIILATKRETEIVLYNFFYEMSGIHSHNFFGESEPSAKPQKTMNVRPFLKNIRLTGVGRPGQSALDEHRRPQLSRPKCDR